MAAEAPNPASDVPRSGSSDHWFVHAAKAIDTFDGKQCTLTDRSGHVVPRGFSVVGCVRIPTTRRC